MIPNLAQASLYSVLVLRSWAILGDPFEKKNIEINLLSDTAQTLYVKSHLSFWNRWI
jgi:hypothetical protein